MCSLRKTPANGAYSKLASHTNPQLLNFSSTWECEQGLLSVKSRSQESLSAPEHDS